MDVALVIFAKAPIPGFVKTRLAASLVEQQCVDLYKCFLLDIVSSMEKTGYHLFTAYSPANAVHIIREMMPGVINVFPQEGNDLGEIMLNAAKYLSGMGKPKMIFVGADIPALNKGHFIQAAKSLDSHDVCIGPAYDGGYYLIGFKEPHPALFQGVDWGTSKVMNQTRERVIKLGLSHFLLPMLHDIDTIEDLVHLHYQMQEAASPIEAHRTKAYLDRIFGITNFYQPHNEY